MLVHGVTFMLLSRNVWFSLISLCGRFLSYQVMANDTYYQNLFMPKRESRNDSYISREVRSCWLENNSMGYSSSLFKVPLCHLQVLRSFHFLIVFSERKNYRGAGLRVWRGRTSEANTRIPGRKNTTGAYCGSSYNCKHAYPIFAFCSSGRCCSHSYLVYTKI